MDRKELLSLLSEIKNDNKLKKEIQAFLVEALELKKNSFHPLVFINGEPQIGDNVYIGFFSEINAKDSQVIIGDNCDIASFVAINAADSHKKCLGLSDKTERKNITIENNVFIGSHSFIGGETHIGHHCVIGAGTILSNAGYIPPYSLVVGNPAVVKDGYFEKKT